MSDETIAKLLFTILILIMLGIALMEKSTGDEFLKLKRPKGQEAVSEKSKKEK